MAFPFCHSAAIESWLCVACHHEPDTLLFVAGASKAEPWLLTGPPVTFARVFFDHLRLEVSALWHDL